MLEQRRRFIADEILLTNKQQEAWRRVKHQQNLDLFVSSQVVLSFRFLGKPIAPVIVQAPELLGVNAPLEEGVTDVLKTVRSFFGDPNSKDSLETQIRKKFNEADVDKSGALDKKEMKALLRATVNRGAERLSEHEVNNLIDIMDADNSGSIEVEELLNAIKPRGSECPYDQAAALRVMAGMVDKVLVLVDPQHTRFNPWERHMIQLMHASFRRKLVFATLVTVEHQNTFKTPQNILRLVHASATEMGTHLNDKAVARELREQVISVGTVVEHKVSKDGKIILAKNAKPRVAWKGLSNRINPVAVGTFTHEIEHSRDMLRQTLDTLRTLNNALLKAWRHFSLHVDRPEGHPEHDADAIMNVKGELASAADAVSKAGEHVGKRTQNLTKRVSVIDCSKQLADLVRLAKEAKKCGQVVLKAIKVGRGASSM